MTTRLQQLLITVLAILSLGTGSVSACVCKHQHQHHGETEKSSSHGPSHEHSKAIRDDDVAQTPSYERDETGKTSSHNHSPRHAESIRGDNEHPISASEQDETGNASYSHVQAESPWVDGTAQIFGPAQCVCEMAAKVAAKPDPIKFKKHIASAGTAEAPEASLMVEIELYRTIAFEKPFYLSDSFYNLAPKRGPPIL